MERGAIQEIITINQAQSILCLLNDPTCFGSNGSIDLFVTSNVGIWGYTYIGIMMAHR